MGNELVHMKAVLVCDINILLSPSEFYSKSARGSFDVGMARSIRAIPKWKEFSSKVEKKRREDRVKEATENAKKSAGSQEPTTEQKIRFGNETDEKKNKPSQPSRRVFYSYNGMFSAHSTSVC